MQDEEALPAQLEFECLQESRKDLTEWFRFAWTEYLKFFAFNATINISALAFLDKLAKPYLKEICAGFIVFDSTMTISSFAVAAYSFKYFADIADIIASIKKLEYLVSIGKEVKDKIVPGIPAWLPIWASAGNGFSSIVFITIWTYIIFYPAAISGQ